MAFIASRASDSHFKGWRIARSSASDCKQTTGPYQAQSTTRASAPLGQSQAVTQKFSPDWKLRPSHSAIEKSQKFTVPLFP